ncbi:hypothetical protein B0H10DRAFT_1951017 [Mycena sp. CBHHK59/15]|nr:hypothetical protein B0H10DRAFT_1951017 [Mycena sp. CBHHK59/15]
MGGQSIGVLSIGATSRNLCATFCLFRKKPGIKLVRQILVREWTTICGSFTGPVGSIALSGLHAPRSGLLRGDESRVVVPLEGSTDAVESEAAEADDSDSDIDTDTSSDSDSKDGPDERAASNLAALGEQGLLLSSLWGVFPLVKTSFISPYNPGRPLSPHICVNLSEATRSFSIRIATGC